MTGEEYNQLRDLQKTVNELSMTLAAHIARQEQIYATSREERHELNAKVDAVNAKVSRVEANVNNITSKFLGGWWVIGVIGTIGISTFGWFLMWLFRKE